MNDIKKFLNLKKIDAFGSPIALSINGNSTYKSRVGGFMTLCMVIIIITLFESQISDFFNRKNIYVSSIQSFNSDPPLLNLQQDDFIFAIGIEQSQPYSFSTNPYYTIEMLQNTLIHDGENVNKSNQRIPLVPCTLERFKSFKGRQNYQTTIEDQYVKFGFSKFLCPEANFNFSLSGSFLSQEFQFVTIRIRECINSTNLSSPVCAPQTDRDEYLLKKGAFRLSFITTNYVINPQNINNDYSHIFFAEDLTFQFQPGYSSKVANIFFRNHEVISDEALIGEKLRTRNFIFRGESSTNVESNEQLSQDQTLTQSQKSLIGQFSPLTLYLRSDNFSFQSKRQYQKIDDLLSYFGGIFQSFLLLFGIFMKIYNEKFFLLQMANKLYDLQDSDEYHDKHDKNHDKHDKDQNGAKKTGRIKIKNSIHSNHSKFSQKQINGLNQKQTELRQLAKLSDVTEISKIKELGFNGRYEFLMWYFAQVLAQKQKLKLTMGCSYISYILSFKYGFANNRNKLIDKAISQVSEDLDIKNLLNQVKQVERIKRLVLSSNQMILFNYFPKPQLNLSSEEVFDFRKMNTKPEKEMNIDQKAQPIFLIKTNSEQVMDRLDFKSFSKLLKAFHQIDSKNSTNEMKQSINYKLINLLGSELRTIFKTSLLVSDLDQNHNQIDLRIQSVMIDELENQLKDEEQVLQELKSKLESSRIPNLSPV